MNWLFFRNWKKARGSQEEHKNLNGHKKTALQYLNIFELYKWCSNKYKVRKLQPDHKYGYKHYVRIVQKNDPIKLIYEVTRNGELHIPVNKESGDFTNSHEYEMVFTVTPEKDEKGKIVRLKLEEKEPKKEEPKKEEPKKEEPKKEYIFYPDKVCNLDICGSQVQFIYKHIGDKECLVSRPMKFMYEIAGQNFDIPITGNGEILFTESDVEQVRKLNYMARTEKDKSGEEHIVLKRDKKIHHLYLDTPHDLDIPVGQNDKPRIRLIYKKDGEKKYVKIEIPKSTECVRERKIGNEYNSCKIQINDNGEIDSEGHDFNFYVKIEKGKGSNKYECNIRETMEARNSIELESLKYFYDGKLAKDIRFIYYLEEQRHCLQVIYKTRFMNKELIREYTGMELQIRILKGEIEEDPKKSADIVFTINAQKDTEGNVVGLTVEKQFLENNGVEDRNRVEYDLHPGEKWDVNVGGTIPLKFYYSNIHTFNKEQGEN